MNYLYFSFLFLDVGAEKLISLEKTAKQNIDKLLSLIKTSVSGTSRVRIFYLRTKIFH